MGTFLRVALLILSLQSWLPQNLLATDAAIRVQGIHFSYEQLSRNTSLWLEIAVELEALGGSHQRYLEQVGITLFLATEKPGHADGYRYYRSEARLVALEVDKPVVVRFYLPPEVVRRDRLVRDPAAALVKIQVAGRDLPWTASHATGLLTDRQRVLSFLERVEKESGVHDGILQPIYLTPFYHEENSRKLDDSPSFVRLSNQP